MSKSAGLMLPKLTYCFHKSFLFTNLSFPGLKTYSNWPTYPQLYVDGELIGGLDILKEMHSTGDLEAVLPKKQARTIKSYLLRRSNCKTILYCKIKIKSPGQNRFWPCWKVINCVPWLNSTKTEAEEWVLVNGPGHLSNIYLVLLSTDPEKFIQIQANYIDFFSKTGTLHPYMPGQDFSYFFCKTIYSFHKTRHKTVQKINHNILLTNVSIKRCIKTSFGTWFIRGEEFQPDKYLTDRNNSISKSFILTQMLVTQSIFAHSILLKNSTCWDIKENDSYYTYKLAICHC